MADAKDKDEVKDEAQTPPASNPNPPEDPKVNPPEEPKAPTTEDPLPPPAVIAENERIARGIPNPGAVMTSPPDLVRDPVETAETNIKRMEDRGAPRADVRMERDSLKSMVATADDLLAKAKSFGSVEDPRRYLPVDPALLAEGDRINIALSEIQMDQKLAPRDASGLTAADRIRSRRDETIPGGYYLVGGQVVNAAGRRIE